MFEHVLKDLRLALRQLRNQPGFTATALLIIALGVGASTAAFTVLNHVLLRPLPFAEPDRLVTFFQTRGGEAPIRVTSAPNFIDWRSRTRSFAAAGAYTMTPLNLVANERPLHVDGASVDSGFFQTLSVKPAAGRTIAAADDPETSPDVVVLSEGLASALYGSPAAAVRQSITLNDQPYTIVGVMPADFRYPSRNIALWTNVHLASRTYSRDNTMFSGIARLGPNVSLRSAQADLDNVASQLRSEYPAENARVGATVTSLRDAIEPRSRIMVLAVFGASLCLVLIACTNLANLLLARGTTRQDEVALRLAVGAHRNHIIRQLLTECLVVVVIGAAAGFLLAAFAMPWLATLVPESLPAGSIPSADWRVFGFACVLIVGTVLGAGLGPAFRTFGAATPLQSRTRAGVGRQTVRAHSALVLVQVAGTVVLLVGAVLLLKSMWRVQQIDPGFRTDGVLTLRTPLPMPTYAMGARRAQFYSRVLTDVRALPGVRSAAMTGYLPMVFGGGIFPASLPGTPQGSPDAISTGIRYITPSYFETLGIRFMGGRDITEGDTFNTPFVVVISQSLGQRLWPGQDPIGRRMNVAFFDRTVVGVVQDIHVRGLEQTSEPQVYMPSDQVPNRWLTFHMPKDLAIRAGSDAEALALAPAVRRIVHDADPQMPVTDVQLFRDVVTSQTAARRLQVMLLLTFAGAAFLLAAVGIHGLISFVASRRRHEVGVRVALGATRPTILGMFVRQGLTLGIGGVVVALPLAYAGARAMQSLLFGVTVSDPVAYGSAMLIAILMAFAGSLIPAVRIASVNPNDALRAE
ncbi:MAG TPA: ABC transporter permease [Vicinamibacterales bacterium]|jgi:predicted permease